MKKYLVIFSYAIDVTAEDENEAYEKASRIWDEITPRTDEMNYEIEELHEKEESLEQR